MSERERESHEASYILHTQAHTLHVHSVHVEILVFGVAASHNVSCFFSCKNASRKKLSRDVISNEIDEQLNRMRGDNFFKITPHRAYYDFVNTVISQTAINSLTNKEKFSHLIDF